MSDKTREEFEQQFPLPEKCEWSQKSSAYCWTGFSVTRHPHDDLWKVWQAAKEKYEPRWIPVSERLPDYDQEVIWYYEEAGIIKIFSLDKDDYPIREWNFPPSHWMPMAPYSTIEPSTQGGGE